MRAGTTMGVLARTHRHRELKKLVKDIEDPEYLDMDIPTAESLRRFLDQYDDDVMLTEDILRAWPL